MSVIEVDAPARKEPRKWYRTTFFNAFVIGGVGFVAPGLWNAMNALGAGGAQKPFLVNAANSLVFALSKYELVLLVKFRIERYSPLMSAL